MQPVAPQMARRVLTGTVACLFLALSAAADHPQSEQGKVIVFVHHAGNEWWVEVALSGQSAGSVVKVEGMDYKGPWVALERTTWGTWGASFHVEPTHPVKFRATWSGGVMVESCWFTHPAGAEACSMQDTWTAKRIAQFSAHLGDDIAVGDGDNDGLQEIYTPSSDGVQIVRWTPSGWSQSSMASGSAGAIAVGDANNDGRREVWTAPVGEVAMHEWDGSAWAKRASIPDTSGVSSLTIGDVDGDGKRALYVGDYGGGVRIVTLVGYTPTVRPLADISESVVSMWIGDGDGDGELDLAVGAEFKGSGGTYLMDHGASGPATVTFVTQAYGVRAVAAGDGDGDAKGEVFTAGVSYDDAGNSHEAVLVSKWVGGAWQTTRTPDLPGYPGDIALGDADNDGRSEIYVTASSTGAPGNLLQVSWTGTAWTLRTLASLAAGQHMALAVGNAEGDSLREIYALAADSYATCCDNVDLYWVANHPSPPMSTSPFDASFTGVRGNAWWVQAGVSAVGGAVAKVDVAFNGGTWQPLENKGWGWAKSYPVPDGTIVRLRATSSTGATDLSDCYRWVPPSGTDAAKVPCSGTSTFAATFHNVGGNEYWAEVVVKANEPVHVVFVYFGDCSADPADMVYRADWGKWVLGGTRIPAGTRLVFEAGGDTGMARSGGYVWPNATPTSGCP